MQKYENAMFTKNKTWNIPMHKIWMAIESGHIKKKDKKKERKRKRIISELIVSCATFGIWQLGQQRV